MRTPEGLAIPGAAVRVTNTQTNKSWVSWTDEAGKFSFPTLPPGHYRTEASQLGFLPASVEVEIPPPAISIAIVLRVATLAELSGEPHTQGINVPAKPSTPGNAKAGAPNPQQNPAANPERQGGRGQLPAGVLNAVRGGFQQTSLTNEAGGQGDENPIPGPQEALAVSSRLGMTASSDSFLLQGTVGQGLSPKGPGDFGGPGGLAPGAPGGPGGFGGAPGGGSGGPGGLGGGGRFQGGGLSPGGVGGGGPFGGGGGGRFLRQQVNRIRFGIYNRYENSVWDAKPYSITGVQSPKVSHFNDRAGFNIGGPLKVPHVYEGSDKTYFFVNFQHDQQTLPVNTFSTVPTLFERQNPGNFSDINAQLFDPFSNGTGLRMSWGSQIPQSMISPTALQLLQFIPTPNVPCPVPPLPCPVVQNFLLQASEPDNSNSLNTRVLHTVNAKFSISAGYNYNSSRLVTLGNFPDIGGSQTTRNQNLDLGLTQNWRPQLVNDTHVNWSRSRLQMLSNNSFVNNIAGELGIEGASSSPIDFGFPAINFTSFSGFNDPVPALTRNQTLRFFDNLTWARNNHTLKFGGEVRRIQLNSDTDPIARGRFTFTGVLTSQLTSTGQTVPGTGNDFADFLLGLPYQTATRIGDPNTYFRSWGFIGYAQDDWRVNAKFTLEYGIRYEGVTPPVELFNNIANLDMNATVTAVALVTPGEVGPFSGPYPRALIHGDYGNWAPRIGFAWQPPIRPKTVVRGGYSIFYNESIYNTLATSYLAYQPPADIAQTNLTTPASPTGPTAYSLTLLRGFPGLGQATSNGKCPPGTLLQPSGTCLIVNTTAVSPFYRDGYAQMWMLGTETTLSRNWLLDLTYTGTKGTDLDLLRAPNRAPPGTSQLDTQNAFEIADARSFLFDQSGANSIYNALQVRLIHRFAHGLMFQTIYTFGKSLDNASSIGGSSPVVVQQDGNFAVEYGLSAFDIRHQFRLFSVYELPFGERRHWATRGAAARAFGNWRVMNVFTWQSGMPLTVLLGGSAANNSGTGSNFSERADQTGNPNLGICGGSPLSFFRTTAFAVPASGAFGDEHRGAVEGPCLFTWNISLAKSFLFGGSRDRPHRLEARWEVQNLTNNANFTGLSTALGSTLFGRVTAAGSMRSMDLMVRFNF